MSNELLIDHASLAQHSFQRVDELHAQFMGALTGGATIEERDT